MFFKKTAASEIATSMERNLISSVTEEAYLPLNKVASAIEHLNAAAEIFDDVGLITEAEVTTTLLECIAKKKAKKKPAKKNKPKSKPKKKSTPATKGLNSEKMVKNLEEKGWVFNADDVNLADDSVEHLDSCDCSDCSDQNVADDVFYASDDMKKLLDLLKKEQHSDEEEELDPESEEDELADFEDEV